MINEYKEQTNDNLVRYPLPVIRYLLLLFLFFIDLNVNNGLLKVFKLFFPTR